MVERRRDATCFREPCLVEELPASVATVDAWLHTHRRRTTAKTTPTPNGKSGAARARSKTPAKSKATADDGTTGRRDDGKRTHSPPKKRAKKRFMSAVAAMLQAHRGHEGSSVAAIMAWRSAAAAAAALSVDDDWPTTTSMAQARRHPRAMPPAHAWRMAHGAARARIARIAQHRSMIRSTNGTTCSLYALRGHGARPALATQERTEDGIAALYNSVPAYVLGPCTGARTGAVHGRLACD